jgi:lysophospholipase L1-like esterase
LAFGDSITAGEVTVPLPALSQSGEMISRPQVQVLRAAYPTVLTDLLDAHYPSQVRDIVVSNAGKGAEAMADAFPRFVDTMDSLAPEAVLLLGGFNDVAGGAGNIDRGSAAMRAMAVEARNRGARVFLATLTPNRPDRQRTIPEPLLLAFNDRIRSIATAERVTLVDLYPALLPGADNYIGVDGLHPTEIGYRRIAENFFFAVVTELENK